jgi:lipid A 3-O-deacylase
MKTGTGYMLILFVLLVITGCEHRADSRKVVGSRQSAVGSRRSIVLHQKSSISNLQSAICNLSEKPFYTPDTFTYYNPDFIIEDLNKMKPLNVRRFLSLKARCCDHFMQVDNPTQPVLLKAGSTAREVYFTATWDNDLLDYTDHYFTNGAGLELVHPAISASPLARLLPGLNYSVNYYGISLVQNMYTPLKLNRPEILVGDRPFASYLIVNHQRISLSPVLHRRLQTELTLGVLGPGAMGNFAQDMIHNETPTGWQYQVKNDFVVNYSLRYDQGLYTSPHFNVAAVAGGQVGTLYDNLSCGLFLQAGRANDRYAAIFQTSEPQKPYRKRMRYYFSLDIQNKLVVYDATMQGGMLNKESVYTIDNNKISRYVFTGKAGVGIGFGKYSLEAEQVFLTPEFEGGRSHMWLRIKNIIRLD